MGFLRHRWRGGDFDLRGRGLLRRTGPARDILLRDFPHCLRDGDVRNAVGLVDPARAIQPLHFLTVEPRHVRPRIRLQLGVRILRQRHVQGPVGCRTWVEPQNDQRHKDHRCQQPYHADPDETCADIGWLMSRRIEAFLRHGGAVPAQASTASEAHGAPAQPQFRSRRASPARRRC